MFKKTSQDKASPARNAPPAAAGRPKGSRPELLSMMPANFLTSPGIIAGIFAFELIYGLVLAGVMSTMKKLETEIVYVPEESMQVAINTPHLDSIQAKLDADAAKEAEEEARAKAKLKAEEEKAKAIAEAEARKKEAARKKALEDEKRKKVKKEREYARNKEISLERALLEAQKPPPPVNFQLKEQANFGPFGPLINPSNDCEGAEEAANVLTIKVPNKLHTLSVDLKLANSPRAFMKATGDFVAEVTIPEPFKPGVKPLIQSQPWVFQGAGLLLWQDENNYIRLERAGMYLIMKEGGGSKPQIMVENCRAGKTVNPVNKLLKSDGPIRLKMERRGSDFFCFYSPDKGKTWIKVKQIPLDLPETVQIGISASNVSTREFTVKFEGFKLSSPPAAAAVAGRAG